MIGADRHPAQAKPWAGSTRMSRAESACAGWSTGLAVTLGSSLPVCADEVKFDRSDTVLPDAPLIRSDVFQGRRQGSETTGPGDPDLPRPFTCQGGAAGRGSR